MIPKRAIVRQPSSGFPSCITSYSLKHTINHSLAVDQHRKYCKILEDLGLELIYIPPDQSYPDSCFVEDNVVIHNNKALITRMGAKSRRGESSAIEKIIREYMSTKKVTKPGTIEGGDIIHVSENLLISGLTQRTNQEGVNYMASWLDVKVDTIQDQAIVHLKSYVTLLNEKTIVVTKPYSEHPVLQNFTKLIIPQDEAYAANTLTIGKTVLIPIGFPQTKTLIKESGFDIIELEISEFQKCEGALTCLSLLF